MDDKECRDFLRDELGVLSDEDLEVLCRSCRVKTYSPHSIIFKEGLVDDTLCIVQRGTVSLWQRYGTDETLRVVDFGKASLIGREAVLCEEPWRYTLRAETRLEALMVPGNCVRELVARESGIAHAMLRASLSQTGEASRHDARGKDPRAEASEALRGERMADIGKVASYIVHDLRVPLSNLKCGVQALAQSSHDGAASEHSALLRSVDEIEELLTSLLDYSRGQVQIRLSVISLQSLCEAVRRRYEESFSVAARFRVVRDASILIDAARMERAVVNVLSNAQKACRRGGSIDISFDCGKEHVEIRVDDSGVGMSHETLASIFEPFYSGFGGYGLGLLSAKQIVEAHEGTIRAESELGKGSSVTITLPLPRKDC